MGLMPERSTSLSHMILNALKKILDGLEFKVKLCWKSKRRKIKYSRDGINGVGKRKNRFKERSAERRS